MCTVDIRYYVECIAVIAFIITACIDCAMVVSTLSTWADAFLGRRR